MYRSRCIPFGVYANLLHEHWAGFVVPTLWQGNGWAGYGGPKLDQPKDEVLRFAP